MYLDRRKESAGFCIVAEYVILQTLLIIIVHVSFFWHLLIVTWFLQQHSKAGIHQSKNIVHSDICPIVTCTHCSYCVQWNNVIFDNNTEHSMCTVCQLTSFSHPHPLTLDSLRCKGKLCEQYFLECELYFPRLERHRGLVKGTFTYHHL